MANGFITDQERLISMIFRFLSFVQSKDQQSENKRKDGKISFTNDNCYLGEEEGYKSKIPSEAREKLQAQLWKDSWIKTGKTGKIADCARDAMSKADNLVNRNQQTDFRNRLNPAHKNFKPEAEQVLFDIYRGTSESEAFKKAVETFGGKYDRIAYLFYIKDENRFLPISSGHFDRAFKILKIDFHTSCRCSWENYTQFISICNEIKDVMGQILGPYLDEELRLIDAHSFLWVIQQEGKGTMAEWDPGVETESIIEQNIETFLHGTIEGRGGKKTAISTVYSRSAEVAQATRERANGTCQLCGEKAPFEVKGKPFLEVHHIEWLSRGGKDCTDNTVALCPNCHRKMHMLDLPEDVEILKAQCGK